MGICQGLGLLLAVNTGNVQLDPALNTVDYVLYNVQHSKCITRPKCKTMMHKK